MLVILDALKYTALGTGRDEYMKVFNIERNALAETVNRERAARKAPNQTHAQPKRADRRKAEREKHRK